MTRILVVDDEPDVRELVEALLTGPSRHIDGAELRRTVSRLLGEA